MSTTATETRPTVTADRAYELLRKGIAAAGDMAATKVNSLVRSRHNVTLEEFHADTTTWAAANPLEVAPVAPPAVAPPKVTAKRAEPEPEDEPATAIDPDSDDAVDQALKLIASRANKPKVDEAAVRRIVDDVVADALAKVNDAFDAFGKRFDSIPKATGVDESAVLAIIKRAMGNGEFPVTRVE